MSTPFSCKMGKKTENTASNNNIIDSSLLFRWVLSLWRQTLLFYLAHRRMFRLLNYWLLSLLLKNWLKEKANYKISDLALSISSILFALWVREIGMCARCAYNGKDGRWEGKMRTEHSSTLKPREWAKEDSEQNNTIQRAGNRLCDDELKNKPVDSRMWENVRHSHTNTLVCLLLCVYVTMSQKSPHSIESFAFVSFSWLVARISYSLTQT